MNKKQKILLALAIPVMVWCAVMMTIYIVKQSNPGKVANEAFDMLNESRIEYGKKALIWDDELAEKAVKHSQWMQDNDLLEHSDYGYYEAIEWSPDGYAYGEQVLKPWESSNPHCQILYSDEITFAAIGIVGDWATFIGE